MENELKRIREALIHVPNSDEVLEYGLALAPHNYYISDIREWNQFLSEWKENTDSSVSDLLQDYDFRADTNNNPYSPRTWYFFHRRLQSDIFQRTTINDQEVYEVTDEQKNLLRNKHAFNYQSFSPDIRKFSTALGDRLGVTREA